MRINSSNPLIGGAAPAAAAYGVSGSRRENRKVSNSTATKAAPATDSADISAKTASMFTPLRVSAGRNREETAARLAAIVGPLHGRV